MTRAVNLIPAPWRQARHRRQFVRRWSVAVALYAALLGLVWLNAQLFWGGPDRAVADRLREVERDLDTTRSQIAQLKPELADHLTTLAASRSVGHEPDWSSLLALLADTLGDHAMLTECRIEPVADQAEPTQADSVGEMRQALRRQHEFTIHGLAQSQSAVSQLLLRLEQTDLFDQVKLLNTNEQPFLNNERAIGFQIRCRFQT